jgi:hypothetical protein
MSATQKIRPITALLWVTAISSAGWFAFVFWASLGFAAKVWRLPPDLAWVLPVALDLFAIGMMLATYLLREANPRVRVYIWSWMFAAMAAQVAVFELYATHLGWPIEARVASVFPPVFLAGSVHAVIIVRRHAGRAPTPRPAAAAVFEGAETTARDVRPMDVLVYDAAHPDTPAPTGRLVYDPGDSFSMSMPDGTANPWPEPTTNGNGHRPKRERATGRRGRPKHEHHDEVTWTRSALSSPMRYRSVKSSWTSTTN